MKRSISLPATLEVRNYLRLFLVESSAEHMGSMFKPEDLTVDLPIKNPITDKKTETLLRKHTTAFPLSESKDLDRYVDLSLEVLRYGKNQEAVWAYQVVTISTIVDKRSDRGHPNVTTSCRIHELTPLTIILGQKLKRTEADELEQWLRQERTQDVHNAGAYERKFMSVNALDSFDSQAYKRSKAKHIVQVGPATFIPFNPKRMKFSPRPAQ